MQQSKYKVKHGATNENELYSNMSNMEWVEWWCYSIKQYFDKQFTIDLRNKTGMTKQMWIFCENYYDFTAKG